MTIQERRRQPQRIYTVLKQWRNKEPGKTYVLYEGPTDRAFWSAFIASRCVLVKAYNKEGVEAVLNTINERQPAWNNIAGIVDPDYWLADESEKLKTPNLLYDDMPDLEMTLIHSSALEKVVRNTLIHLSDDDFIRLCTAIRDRATRLGAEFGYFRLIDFRHRHYNLSFNSVSFRDVVDVADETFNHRLTAERLVQKSSVSSAELSEMVVELRAAHPPNPRLCRGKDVLALIAIVAPVVYKETVGKEMSGKASIQLKSNELFRALRIAFEFAHFKVTALFHRIRDWERDNSPFRIIQDYPLERTTA